jgi:hypothetical protein
VNSILVLGHQSTIVLENISKMHLHLMPYEPSNAPRMSLYTKVVHEQ